MSVTIRKATPEEKGHGLRTSQLYIVEKDGTSVGCIVKARNGRRDIHPWKVHDTKGTKLAAFYEDKDAATIGPDFFDYDRCKIGGKVAAFTYARRTF